VVCTVLSKTGLSEIAYGLALFPASSREEDLMWKELLTVASFTVGGSGAALVGYLARTPMALTHQEPSVVIIPASFAADVPVAVETDSTLVPLPATKTTPARKQAKALPPKSTLEPCSEWTVIGARYIEAQGATGVRNVRTLCETSAR